MESVSCESFSAMLDLFYEAREQQERIRQRGADLIRTASTARDRLRRKLAQQERDYAETQNRDQLRVCGDLITANLCRMERGSRQLECENFYDPEGGTITIPLDPLPVSYTHLRLSVPPQRLPPSHDALHLQLGGSS